jgi:putative toxin-antitoxin system antitoxin component (TIGR02293 family)
MENLTLVRKYLGGRRTIGSAKSESDFVAAIRRGLPVGVFESLRRESRLSEETIYKSLKIAKRTAARRKGHAARLKPSESEGALRLARVLAAATEALGDQDKARQWLQAENRALGGSKPIDLLDTGIGFQQVMDVLSRIEFGVYS